MKHTDYLVCIAWSSEDESYLAVVPDLPGCVADGGTDQEALENARKAIANWLEVSTSLERDIPAPRDYQKLDADALQEYEEFQQGLQEHIQKVTREAVQQALTQVIPEIVKSLHSGFGVHQMIGSQSVGRVTYASGSLNSRIPSVSPQRHLHLSGEGI